VVTLVIEKTGRSTE